MMSCRIRAGCLLSAESNSTMCSVGGMSGMKNLLWYIFRIVQSHLGRLYHVRGRQWELELCITLPSVAAEMEKKENT